MDDLLIKANNTVRDGTAPKSTAGDNLSALAGLAVSFNDMLHKAGLRIESGLYALAGLGAITERAQPVNSADDYRDHEQLLQQTSYRLGHLRYLPDFELHSDCVRCPLIPVSSLSRFER